MPKLVFTQEEVDDYFKGSRYHHFKDATVKLSDDIAIHADGVFPLRLLKQRRPNEPLEVLLYRELIWTPITKPTFSKVFSSLQKIRRSRDWAIKYENLDEFSKIVEEENIENYCEKNFPYFTSLTNWVFSIMLRKYLIDANAVVLVLPIEEPVDQTGYVRPFPTIFSSIHVIDYRDEDYCVLQNPVDCYYTVEDQEFRGKSYYFVTTMNVFRYDQVDDKGNYQLVVNYTHNLGELPAFKLGGVLIDQAENQFLYESRISSMVPQLDEAVREYSDLQAAKVLHIYPERWEYMNNECATCKGTKRRHNPLWSMGCGFEEWIECDTCHGHGYVNSGPYSKIMVKPPDPLNPTAQIPMPPAGFIEKDVKIIELQEAGVAAHIYNALAAINFEFLAKTPLNQSGIAKEVDKDELNNTVHSIAEDILAAMDKIYYLIALERYQSLYSEEDIQKMTPETVVPEIFDLLSAQHLEDELVLSRKNQANPIILNALEIDYASKRFNDESVRDMLTLTLELDPLPNEAESDKVLMLTNNGITELTYVMTSNIQAFIEDAIAADQTFVEKPTAEQKQIIQKMAQDQIDKASKAKAIVRSMFLANGGNGLGTNQDQNTNLDINNSNNQDGANFLQPDISGNSQFNQNLQQTNPLIATGNA